MYIFEYGHSGTIMTTILIDFTPSPSISNISCSRLRCKLVRRCHDPHSRVILTIVVLLALRRKTSFLFWRKFILFCDATFCFFSGTMLGWFCAISMTKHRYYAGV